MQSLALLLRLLIFSASTASIVSGVYKVYTSEWGACDPATCLRSREVSCNDVERGVIVNSSLCDTIPSRVIPCDDCVGVSASMDQYRQQTDKENQKEKSAMESEYKVMEDNLSIRDTSNFSKSNEKLGTKKTAVDRQSTRSWTIIIVMNLAVSSFLCAFYFVWRQARREASKLARKGLRSSRDIHPRDFFEPDLNPFRRNKRKEPLNPTFPVYKDIEIGVFQL